MARVCILLTVILFVGLIGCENRTVIVRENRENPSVTSVPAGDPEMEAAIAKARSTVAEFIEHLQKPQANMEAFFIKKPYETRSDTLEHIWIHVNGYRDGKLHGTIDNDPVDIDGISYGSPVTVGEDEITDWMIKTDAGVIGGFTRELLKKRKLK